MKAWAFGAKLDQATFAERFLGRSADDRIAGDILAAALGADVAKTMLIWLRRQAIGLD